MNIKNNVDVVDIAILRELKTDCKQSYRDLAHKLNIHPNTLMQRIKKLEKEHVINGYYADIDYRKIGYDYHGVSMLRTKKSRVTENMWEFEDIKKIPQVEAIYALTGPYDAIAIIRVKNREEMVEVLKKMQQNQMIAKTNTQIILRTFKNPSEYNPL